MADQNKEHVTHGKKVVRKLVILKRRNETSIDAKRMEKEADEQALIAINYVLAHKVTTFHDATKDQVDEAIAMAKQANLLDLEDDIKKMKKGLALDAAFARKSLEVKNKKQK